ncbi:hypothetical protein Cme02nite_50800 [Catellatospora methionotrophica]|uniref:Uncharacterized protein n=1 Tax=Catellatospora methionotrophica TaxID=121620 RepID=A0A8J3L9A9_9ACTN|nr:hypothetical protein Cme02nite_50800 [Catellatospora methionotrophica]
MQPPTVSEPPRRAGDPGTLVRLAALEVFAEVDGYLVDAFGVGVADRDAAVAGDRQDVAQAEVLQASA